MKFIYPISIFVCFIGITLYINSPHSCQVIYHEFVKYQCPEPVNCSYVVQNQSITHFCNHSNDICYDGYLGLKLKNVEIRYLIKEKQKNQTDVENALNLYPLNSSQTCFIFRNKIYLVRPLLYTGRKKLPFL